MVRVCVLGLLGFLLTGCAAQMVEKDANDSCAKLGKKAFIFDARQSGIPFLVDSASAMVLCVGPDDVTHLPPTFGADAVSASNFTGAGILSVNPGAVAAKAGIKPNDIVYELAGHPITSAADLRTEVNSVARGEQVNIKLRRNGSKDTQLIAQF
jgi:membrane-associated protease RseP (regulator of RpoE activity)